MSIAGIWKLTLNSPLGAQQADLNIQEVDGTYQGTLGGSMGAGPNPVEELKAEGDNLSFAADADTPVGRLRLAFNGTVTGDTITGKYRIPFGEFDFSGTRAEARPPGSGAGIASRRLHARVGHTRMCA